MVHLPLARLCSGKKGLVVVQEGCSRNYFGKTCIQKVLAKEGSFPLIKLLRRFRCFANEVFSLLIKLVSGAGMAALIATHNPEIAARMDRVLKLDQGKLMVA